MSIPLKNQSRLVIDLFGDSTMYQMESVGQNTITPGNIRLIFGYAGVSYWVIPANLGAGITALGNALSTALGIPVDFRLGAVGGSALCQGAGGSAGYWTTTGSIYGEYLQICTDSSENADIAIMDIGTNDAGVTRAGAFRNGLQKFLVQAAGQALDKLFLVGLGNYYGGSSPGVDEIRGAQRAALSICPQLVFAGSRYDLPMVDGVHLTAAGYASNGRRIAQSILKRYGYVSTSADGPRITGASRSGNTVTVSCAHAAGATTLAQASSGIPANFRFSTDGFNSFVMPTGFSIPTANTMAFTFSSLPSGVIWMDYAYGNCAADTKIVIDDVFPQGDSRACPLQPCDALAIA